MLTPYNRQVQPIEVTAPFTGPTTLEVNDRSLDRPDLIGAPGSLCHVVVFRDSSFIAVIEPPKAALS